MLRILRGLGSRTLRCGCLVGLYETYSARTVAVIDAKSAGCGNEAHRLNADIDTQSVMGLEEGAQPPSTMPTMNR